MNKTFKVIWNHATQNWVAVSELNKAKGKTKSLSLAKKGIFKVSLITSALALMSGQTMAITGAENQLADSTVNYCYYKSAHPNGQVVCGGSSTSATGLGAIAIGNGAVANSIHGNGVVAIGINSKVDGASSVALGAGNIVNGEVSHAIGSGNNLKGNYALAFGSSNKIESTSPFTNIAVGGNNKIFNSGKAYAIGLNNAIGSSNHPVEGALALGNQNFVFGTSSTSISSGRNGQWNNVTRYHASIIGGPNSYSIGTGNILGPSSGDSVLLGNSIRVGASDALVTTKDDGNHTVAWTASTSAMNSIAIGNNIIVNNANNAIAVGRNTTVNAGDSIAMGTNAVSNTANSVVIGANAKDTTKMGYSQATAVGFSSTAANDSVAIGSGASATGDITNSTFSGWATAVGRLSNASGRGGIAVGNGAAASGIDSAAFGSFAKASANYAYSFGYHSNATKGFSIAAGFYSNASGESSMALGTRARSLAPSAITLGASAIANGGAYSAIAVGSKANVYGVGAIAFGNSTLATEEGSIAFGDKAEALIKDSVALGAGSLTGYLIDPVVGTSNATVNGIRYGDFAGANPLSTVSVGNTNEKRTITNVAAGRILANSTDAINGSQLYMVASKLADEINNITKTMTWNATASQNGGTATGITNATVNNGDTVTFEAGKNITITQDGRKFTIEATGSGSTTNVVVDAGEGIQVNSTTNGNDVTYTVTAKTDGTTIKIDNGNITANTGKINEAPSSGNGAGVVTVSDADKGRLATVDNVANAINSAGWVVNTGKADDQNSFDTTQQNHSEMTVSAGKRVNFLAGKNMEVKRDGSNITYATSENVTFTTVQVGGDNGPKITNDGNNIKISDKDGNPTKITNVAPGEISATSKDSVNGSQLYAVGNNINNLNNRVNKIDKDLRAGIAGAAAIAGLPQVRGNGKSMMAVAASNYRGENAVALGYTRASDNGKVLLKLSGSTNTRGDVVSAVGLGYEW